MNTTTRSPLVESCKSFLRAFLIAVAFSLLAGATLSSVGHATAAPVATVDNGAGWQGQSITCAGRIRQQAQRIAKLYLQIGMGLEVGHARQQMSRAAQQIDDDIAELKQHPLDAKAGEALARVTQSWTDFQGDFTAPFSSNSKSRVFDSADALSRHTGKLAATFERSGDAPAASLLDLSLRQNMLVQRLARLYLMAYAGDTSAGLQVDIEQARREFSAALDELARTRSNSEASRRALELTKMQWIFFERAIENVGSPRDSNPRHVATTSEQILELLDEVSAQYARG